LVTIEPSLNLSLKLAISVLVPKLMSLGVEYKYLTTCSDGINNPCVTLVIISVRNIIGVNPMSSDLTCRLGKLTLVQPQKLEPLGGYEHDRGLGLGDT
jgi:hypothetical protein